MLRIGAYQGVAEPGDWDGNSGRTLELLQEAHRLKVDFACLPECFLSGYGPPRVLRQSAVSIREARFRDWLRQCDFGDMVVIVGFIEKRGEHLHNSAAIIQNGKLLGLHHKSISGSPHESAAVAFAHRFRVWKAHGVCFGVLICAESGLIEPSLLLAEQGARLILAPHYAFIPMDSVEGHRQRVRNNHIARAVENDCWIVKANTVTAPMQKLGDDDGFGYGDSFILDNRGVAQAEAGLFSSGWIVADAPTRVLAAQRESRIETLPDEIREQVARLYWPNAK